MIGKRWRQSVLQMYKSLTQKGKTPDNTSLTFRINLHLTPALCFIPGLRFLLCKENLGKYWEQTPAIKILIAIQIQAIEEHWN